MTAIKLFDFQLEAANQLTEAVEEWVQTCAQHGAPRLGRTEIPFVGHLKAVTGAGKTPILASVVSNLGSAVVLWTSKSGAVVDQTVRNLTGKYRHLLPPDTKIVRERPSKGDWDHLMESQSGLTIWVTTVGSWNEAEAAGTSGSESARLNMHRPHRDWGGDSSPWDQLRSTLVRPLWVVYDESHNQTIVQLDQLVDLGPVGFILASATPPEGGKFEEFAKVIAEDEYLASVAANARVKVSTRDVVAHQLLKHTIDVENYDSDPETLLDAVIELHTSLTQTAIENGAAVSPKALYVVEKSNPTKGELVSRPVAIWEHLVGRDVDPQQIAIYTQTKVLPDDAVRVTSLSGLLPHHTHIICNRTLQEGWDDPEAYIEYFDDESNSYVRISQVIGRALRQPNAQHFEDEALNTATLFVRVPNNQFEAIIDGLKQELALYAVDEDNPAGSAAIRVRTKKDPLPTEPVKPTYIGQLSLPQYQLGEAELADEESKIKAMSTQLFVPEHLQAPGGRTVQSISLRGEADRYRYERIASGMKRRNGEYLRRRIQILNRHCAHLLNPTLFTGPGFDQYSCSGSVAQSLLAERASAVIDTFESTVELVPNGITTEEIWKPGPHRPTSADMIAFNNAVHERYARNGFRAEELEFARALDNLNEGVWLRNPSRGDGYGIPLPAKVGTSSTFYPDFIWWTGEQVFAIDPTGNHIFEAKVRSKLLSLDTPTIILVAKGRLGGDWATIEGADGYTLARARKGRLPAPEYFSDLNSLLRRISGKPT
ncbi:hypothetical protein ACNQP7_04735 [Mycolicibacterium fortuitum]|uniref:hypothetical protein n=1 Tax=Mycolicibacterium fortuitum TaxID=1766 RepID=UPI003AB0BB6D